MAAAPPYVSLKQRDAELEDVQKKPSGQQHAQIETDSLSGFSQHQEPVSKYRLDVVEIVASAAFVLAAFTCVALAVIASTKGYMTSQLDNIDYVSKLDCSVIQSDKDYFAGNVLGAVIGGHGTSTPDPGSVNQVERSFILDLTTPPTLSFLQARVLDVMWNLIAGQGIRLVMGYVTYVVCAHWFAAFIVRSRLSYDFYTAVSFQGMTLSSTYETLKQFFRFTLNSRLRKGRDWLIMMLWMVIGMTYTMSVPSLLNAAAGYMVPSEPRWEMPNGDLVSDYANSFRACWLVKNDSRIGFDEDTIISGPLMKSFRLELLETQQNGGSPDRWREVTTGYPRFDEITPYYGQLHDILNSTWAAAEERFNFSHAKLKWNETEALRNYSSSLFLKSTTNITINEHEFKLSAPPINLGLLPQDKTFRKNESSTFATFSGPQPCYKGEIISLDFNPPLLCVSSTDGYAWGFSKNILVGILSTQAVWCIATWGIWLFVRRASRKLGQKRPGTYLTALVLAESINADLDGQLDGLSETELSKKLGKSDGVKSRKSGSVEMSWRLSSRRPFNA